MNTSNPYSTPSAEIKNDINHDGYDETSVFNPKGRFNRSRYVVHFFNLYFGFILISILIGMLAGMTGNVESLESPAFNIVILVLIIPFFITYVIFLVRRLHDMNMHGVWSLVSLIPFINIIFGVYVLFKKGTVGSNQYGPEQKPNSVLVKIFTWLYGLMLPVAIIGILAAIAIPQYQQYLERASGS